MSTSRRRSSRRTTPKKPTRPKASDLFFGAVGTAILYHEVYIAETPDAPLLFVALFLYGLIPISRADPGKLSIREVIVMVLGGQMPELEGKKKDSESKDSGKDEV